MRRATSLQSRFAPLFSVLLLPACFSLPKVDVIQVIDDFANDAGLEDAALTPTWSNTLDTTTTLKCVSDPFGTLCMLLSFVT